MKYPWSNGNLLSRKMNTFHQEPRSDCKDFAPCGIHSLSKCRKYKGTLKECAGCKLVRRKSKTLNHTPPARKVCPKCGQEYNISMFGLRKVYRGNKMYVYHASWCKICTAKSNLIRSRKLRYERLHSSTIGTGGSICTEKSGRSVVQGIREH